MDQSFFPARTQGRFAASMLLLLLLLGIAAGCCVGLFSPHPGMPASAGEYVSASVLPASLAAALWNAARLFLLLLLSAACYFGVLVVPVAVCLRGYLLGCSVAVFFSAYSYRGLLYAFVISGIPAFLTVPCFLAAAYASLDASGRLLALRFGGSRPDRRASADRALFLAPAVILFDAFYSFYILPALLANL